MEILYGLAFSLTSIYFLILFTKQDKKYAIFIAGVLIGLACLVRNNYYIFLIAEVLYLLLYMYKMHKLKYLIIIFTLIILGVTPSKFTKSYYQSRYHVELNKGIPTVLYLIMGNQFSDKAPRLV